MTPSEIYILDYTDWVQDALATNLSIHLARTRFPLVASLWIKASERISMLQEVDVVVSLENLSGRVFGTAEGGLNDFSLFRPIQTSRTTSSSGPIPSSLSGSFVCGSLRSD